MKHILFERKLKETNTWWAQLILLQPRRLRGNCTPNQTLAWLLLYLKIINIFFWKIRYASYSKLFKELKNGIEFLVGPAFFEIMDQNSQNIVLINNSWTDWPSWISMLFLISLDNLL